MGGMHGKNGVVLALAGWLMVCLPLTMGLKATGQPMMIALGWFLLLAGAGLGCYAALEGWELAGLAVGLVALLGRWLTGLALDSSVVLRPLWQLAAAFALVTVLSLILYVVVGRDG